MVWKTACNRALRLFHWTGFKQSLPEDPRTPWDSCLFDSGHLNLMAEAARMLVPPCSVILGPKVVGMIQLQTHLDEIIIFGLRKNAVAWRNVANGSNAQALKELVFELCGVLGKRTWSTWQRCLLWTVLPLLKQEIAGTRQGPPTGQADKVSLPCRQFLKWQPRQQTELGRSMVVLAREVVQCRPIFQPCRPLLVKQ